MHAPDSQATGYGRDIYTARIMKKSRPSRRLKVLAWKYSPQRVCTAVTLFAAIPCQSKLIRRVPDDTALTFDLVSSPAGAFQLRPMISPSGIWPGSNRRRE
jgi:hypothetical protein